MLRAFALAMIRLYWMTLSPIIGNVCRFQPSCSRYTAACIHKLGFFRGGWLGFKRICRCHPFCEGGYDPPPVEGPLPEYAQTPFDPPSNPELAQGANVDSSNSAPPSDH